MYMIQHHILILTATQTRNSTTAGKISVGKAVRDKVLAPGLKK